MVSNTKSDSPSPLPPPSPLPKYLWPRPGLDDWPRFAWSQYLRLWSDELDRTCGGETGHFLGGWFLSLALQAESLGAHSPEDHSTKAMLEAERAAAWEQAVMDEAAQAGVWVITVQDENPLASEMQAPREGARRGYFATDMDAETNCN